MTTTSSLQVESNNKLACSDFNYQQPIQSMYMSTIPNIPKPQFRPKTAELRNNLRVDDIQGTRSKFIEKPRVYRDTYINKNDDIDRSHSKVLIAAQVNKPLYSMMVDDIKGTRSKMNKFTTTRNTNPLNPVYEVPVVEYYPVEQPKFVRDNLITHDIEGTSTKESFAMRMMKEDKFQDSKKHVLSSIQLKKKNRLRTTQNSALLNVEDINLKREKRFRETNPLDPEYLVPNQAGIGAHKYGQIKGSKVPPIKQKFNNPDFSLFTEDIPGARAKSKNIINPAKEQIKQAKVSSLKRGITSNRSTNPLNPSYKFPGWSEVAVTKPSSMARPKTAHQKFDAFIK